MRRSRLGIGIGVVLTCACSAAAPAVTSGASAPAPAPAPGAVAVNASEFALTLSRSTVHAGPVRVQLVNRGEDDHDLRVEGSERWWQYATAGPGESRTRTLRLRPGRYRLICTLEGHEALGMHARLRARR